MKGTPMRRIHRMLFGSFLTLVFAAPVQTLPAGETSSSGSFKAKLEIAAEPVSDSANSIRRAMLGDEVEIYVSFENPSLDKEGMSGVLMDSIIRRPDNSIVCEHRNLSGWVEKKPAPQGELIEANCHFELKPEPEDPPGRYTVEIHVKDIPAKKTVVLTSVIEFVGAEKK